MKKTFVMSFCYGVCLPLLFLPCVPAWAADDLEAKLAENRLERIKYDNPGLTVDLGVGLWSWPIPMDVNGDGHTDLVVVCEDTPYNGTYVFEHPGTKDKMPVFKKARRIGRGIINVQVSFVDGKPRVLSPGKEYPDFANSGVEKPVTLPIPANPHPNRLRGNMWKYVDYDGDGKLDILIGIDDWSDYGWDNTFDDEGNWTRGPLRGLFYVAKNIGTNEKPEYDKPFLLKDVDGDNVETFGWPCPNMLDWDGDGDLDMICGEFLDGFNYFQNVGTRTEPKWAKGVKLTLEDGRPLVMDMMLVTPVAFDWNGDGHPDLLCGSEDGNIALIENTGRFATAGDSELPLRRGQSLPLVASSKSGTASSKLQKYPLFLEPKNFKQEADEVKCRALATPCVVDWDGDGDLDIVSGNSAGYIEFFENLSGPGVDPPKWAARKLLEVDGKPIRILAGPKGSIQGPAEAKFGYTTLTAADWDGDGLPDIMANSIWGKIVWFKNIGTKTAPKLVAARPVEVEWEGEQPRLAYGWLKPEGKALLTQWRTTPVMYDLNEDGLMDLIMLDHEGYLVFFERKKIEDKFVLLPPQRVFVDENGNPLRLNGKIAGGSGRRKICFVDYDKDGKVDFLVNSRNANYFRQIRHEGGKYVFRDMGTIDDRRLAGHSSSPAVADFDGNGIPDPLIGAEDGYFYYKKNPMALGAKKPYLTAAFKHETASWKTEGDMAVIAEFKNDAKAFANRDYVWKNIPKEFESTKEKPVFFTQTFGGTVPSLTITAKKDGTLLMATGTPKQSIGLTNQWDAVAKEQLAKWTLVQKDAFHYTDGGKTGMSIYSRPVQTGERYVVPQFHWTGCILILRD